MPYNDELVFEKDLVNYLYTHCGWEAEVIKYPTAEDLVKNWAEIIFINNKQREVLNNQPLTEGEIDQILNQVNSCKSPVALNNFINGNTITIKRDNQNDTLHFGMDVSIKLFDRMEIAGGRSRYQIAEQPHFKTNNAIYPERRGDFMLLINGMPVYHIELKKSGVSITQAENQIKKYMDNGVYTGIFSLVQVFVAMNPDEAVYFANPGTVGKFNKDFYFHWCDVNNQPINEWHNFAHSLLSIPMAHEMIGYYTIPDASDGVLKVMRSYQYHAASRIAKIVRETHWTQQEQHGGFVWHTTGSGKTMTSFKAAKLIAEFKKADKVIFLIDRIELGEQSFDHYVNYSNPQDYIQQTDNTAQLITLLKSNEYKNAFIVTSIQKMSRLYLGSEDIKESVLKEIQKKKIVFIIDECHRSQAGDMHQSIKRTFPNAMYFGFTGTPDPDYTVDIFGSEIHRYTIANGIKDKNVLGFDPYMVCTLKEDEIRKLVALEATHSSSKEQALSDEKRRDKYLYYINHGETPCPMTEIEKRIPLSQYKEPKYKNAVVENILNNWNVRSVNGKFSAIFATSSIPEAIEYYYIFKDKNEHLKITCLFDPSDGNDDFAVQKTRGITKILTDYNGIFDKSFKIGTYDKFKTDLCDRLARREQYKFITDSEKLDLVIVVDQLLTGFDSKWISTLYLDKVMEGKNLIQACSRTNRLFGPEKKHGIIVMYRQPYTMWENLQQAVKDYSGNMPLAVFVDKLEANLKQMNALYAQICEMFAAAELTDFSKLPEDTAWRGKFAKLFSQFNDHLDSAKMQGVNWDNLVYNFDTGVTVQLDLDKTTYLVLVQRYKEMFTPRGNGEGGEPPFDIDTHITEIRMDAINDDFMNSRFELYLRDLSGGDPRAKEKALTELHKSFAYLSVEDQDYARSFLNDVDNGLEVEAGKTFKDYITEYKTRDQNDKIHKIATAFGINEAALRELIVLSPKARDVDEFGRFKSLMNGFDIDKAVAYYGEQKHRHVSKREAKMWAEDYLRQIIINGV